MTAEVIAKLEQAFTQGFNITHACGLAEISQNSYYDYIQENPDFSKKVEWLRSKPYIRTILGINKLINSEDPTTLRWYAERKNKDEFSLRNESTGANGGAIEHSITVTQEEIRKQADLMREK